MAAPLRVGLVGCGRLAELGYVPALSRATGVTLGAVADPDPGRRAAVVGAAFRHGMAVMAHRDAASLLDRTDVDALVLATPAVHHVADAALAVAAGRAVLVEKPPAPDAPGAAELAGLGQAVRVAFNRRFDPRARAVRDSLPAQGPLDLRLELHYRRASWAPHAVRDDVLLDLVPHLVDWLRWLTGADVADVAAPEVGHDRALLWLSHDRGTARLAASADSLHRELIEVRGAGGRLVARHRAGGFVGAVAGRIRSGPHPLVTSLTAQLEAFANVVAGGTEPDLGTVGDGLAAMAVVDAARSSAARGGRPTPVAEHQERAPC